MTRAVAFVGAALNLFGSALILVLMMIIGLDVLGRNLFGAPLPGVPEIVSLSILVIVFVQAPEALIRGRLTRTDGLVRALVARRPSLGRLLETSHDLAGAFVFALIAKGSWPMLVEAVRRREFVGAIGELTVPVWPVRLAIVAGCSLLVVHFVRRAFGRWHGGSRQARR